MTAIKNLYSEDAVFFEAKQRFEGRQAIGDAVAASALAGIVGRAPPEPCLLSTRGKPMRRHETPFGREAPRAQSSAELPAEPIERLPCDLAI
jgi:hypothetical protein